MNSPLKRYEGRCHCGAMGFGFGTARPTRDWVVRACQCGFCRSHGARTTADPTGSVVFNVSQPDRLLRYRFASRSLEFLVCSGCGVYLGALHASERGCWATLNVNVLPPLADLPAPIPFTPDDAPLADKQAGRESRWTPVVGGVG